MQKVAPTLILENIIEPTMEFMMTKLGFIKEVAVLREDVVDFAMMVNGNLLGCEVLIPIEKTPYGATHFFVREPGGHIFVTSFLPLLD